MSPGEVFRRLVSLFLLCITTVLVARRAVGATEPAPYVSFDPPEIRDRLLGSSISRSAPLTNTGDGPLHIVSITSEGDDYSVDSSCPTSPDALAPSASCYVTITFTPAALGKRDGSIVITSDAVFSPRSYPLDGEGASLGWPVFDPPFVQFATRDVGTTSEPKTITVTNEGTGPLRITEVSIFSPDETFTQTNDCARVLELSERCSISVRFTPHRAATELMHLSVSTDASSLQSFIWLRGTGVVGVP